MLGVRIPFNFKGTVFTAYFSSMSKTNEITSRVARKQKIYDAIKSYKDFPKPGVVFRDIFPVLRNPKLFEDTISLLVEEVKEKFPTTDVVLGIESRGFIFAPLIAMKLGAAFVPIRKAGKLPGDKHTLSYALEYGTDTVEITKECLKPGQKAIIVDDLLATGGTLEAAVKLLNLAQVKTQGCLVVIELEALKGRDRITQPVLSLIKF